MRKQRFMAIQKIAEQKKLQVESAQAQQSGGSMDHVHGHVHGHHHGHGHPHAPKQTVSRGPGPGGFGQIQGQNVGSRGCSIVGPLFQEVRFKVHDPKAHSKGGTLENTINGGRGGGGGGGAGPDEESGGGGGGAAGPPPPHIIHPGKVGRVLASKKTY